MSWQHTIDIRSMMIEPCKHCYLNSRFKEVEPCCWCVSGLLNNNHEKKSICVGSILTTLQLPPVWLFPKWLKSVWSIRTEEERWSHIYVGAAVSRPAVWGAMTHHTGAGRTNKALHSCQQKQTRWRWHTTEDSHVSTADLDKVLTSNQRRQTNEWTAQKQLDNGPPSLLGYSGHAQPLDWQRSHNVPQDPCMDQLSKLVPLQPSLKYTWIQELQMV